MSTSTPEYRGLSKLQPTQLLISETKLARVSAALGREGPAALEPLPILDLDGDVVLTDGHTRAAALVRAGISDVAVVWDEDDLDLDSYRINRAWCRDEDIRSPADLVDRIVPDEEYAIGWHGPCDRLHAFWAGPWEEHRTEHYRFRYRPGGMAARDIEAIAAGQERALETINETLGVSHVGPIRYWLCETLAETGALWPDGEQNMGQAFRPDILIAVYGPEGRCVGVHEDAHLVAAAAIGFPPHPLLREGLAMMLDETHWGHPNEAWVELHRREGRLVPLTDLVGAEAFHEHPWTVTYPLAGAFFARLVESFGMPRVRKLYGSVGEDLTGEFQRSFGISLRSFGDELQVACRRHAPGPGEALKMDSRLRDSGTR